MTAECADQETAGSPPVLAAWSSRPVLARGLRTGVFLVPVLLAAVTIFLGDTLLPRQASDAVRLVGLGGLLVLGSAASWLAHRVLQRLMPLALLLEMSLCFPESAPSRLRLAQRSSSASELASLAAAPESESAQQAAERMLTLVTALGRHDRQTRGHAERVRAYAELIAQSMGLSPRERDRLRWASLLHDIGKLVVPATLLNKPGKPDIDEWAVLRAHPHVGNQMGVAPLE